MTRRAEIAVAALLVLVVVFLPGGVRAAASSHYVPIAGDRFAYHETITITNGVGNYSGYTENGNYTGSIAVTGVLPNYTESADYLSAGTWSNSAGQSEVWSESGSFTFSAATFLYVQGTDNQTGYVHPYVWFYMNNSLSNGSTFELLNTPMTVVSTDVPFPVPFLRTGYAATIFAEGNGTYERDDSYGLFDASYQWKTYFDPGTGYILGYVYTEKDSNGAGDGFTYTDSLADRAVTFELTSATPPASSVSSTSPGGISLLLVAIIVVVIAIVVVLVLVAAWSRRRSRARLPRHPSSAIPGTLPSYAPPPPVNLIPRDQPPVQQVVIRETVKVPCRYCGTLIDSTATNCPNCGAPRT